MLAQEVDPGGEEYRVLPAEGPSREELERAVEGAPARMAPWLAEAQPVTKRGLPQVQFSLAELITVFTLLAVGLSASTWLPLEAFAGAMGGVTCLCLIVFWWRPPQTRFAYLFWGTMGVLYVAAATAAVVRSFS